jgi:protein-L-isoaspartate(D-aspartate) O-methyltransferase
MTQEKLTAKLIKQGYLKTPAIIDAFHAIDRADFVPSELQNVSYLDHALPIGHDQTISQPLTVAFMLELLQPQKGEKILDIGTGSGWSTALLAHIVGEKGYVVTAEHIPELVKMAKKNIGKYDFIKNGTVRIMKKDGSKGYRTAAPYDKIIAAASANEIPKVWMQQVRVGGTIVAPVKNSMVRLHKKSPKAFDKREHFGFSFVPLVSGV